MNNKDTIYIDVDDEITGIIDKVQDSSQKIVALVLPKRATVFQSLVNMKLLKRTADDQGKRVVLITSEANLLPLAGAVGMYVAKSLQSKPEIPIGPSHASPADDEADAPLERSAPVGTLAPAADDDESIEVDNSSDDSSASDTKKKRGKKGKKGADGGKKKFNIPNFEKFRTRLILGAIAGVILISGIILAFFVLPKATVILKTDTQNIDTSFAFAVDPAAQEVNTESKVVPAKNEEFRKTDTEKVPATGQKDLGTRAAGQVTLSTVCSSNVPTIPTGTTVNTGNLSYGTAAPVTLSPTVVGGQCRFQGTADVVATSAGEQYNIEIGKTFAVSGYSAVSGTNAAVFTGGTSKIVKIIRQEDVDLAKQRINERAGGEAPDELKQKFDEADRMALTDTLTLGNATVTSTPNVGDEASEVTVTSTSVFTMLGIKKDDLKKLVEEEAKSKLDTSKQRVQDNGIDKATIKATAEKKPNTRTEMSIQATVVAGPQLDEAALKQEVAGKKRGEIQELFKNRPGVRDVEVAYSPFWVQSTPKSTSKITFVFEKAE